MAEESSGERMWSDGQSLFRVATVGVRLFAGFLDWIFTARGCGDFGVRYWPPLYNGVFAGESGLFRTGL